MSLHKNNGQRNGTVDRQIVADKIVFLTNFTASTGASMSDIGMEFYIGHISQKAFFCLLCLKLITISSDSPYQSLSLQNTPKNLCKINIY